MNEELEKYILDHISGEDELLKKLNRETYVKIHHARQVSGHLQGKILEMLSKMIKPKYILELGTFTGYSAICLAKGLKEDGELHTIEINDELEDFILKYFTQSPLNNKLNLHIGDALEIIPNLDIQFDLVFIDANKSKYPEYYNLVFDKVSDGGYIIADNVIWDEKILDKEIKSGDYFTKGIIEFNEFVKNDNRVEKVIFPVRDGMMIIRKMV